MRDSENPQAGDVRAYLGTGHAEVGILEDAREGGQAPEAVDGAHMHLEALGEAPLDGCLHHGSQLHGLASFQAATNSGRSA